MTGQSRLQTTDIVSHAPGVTGRIVDGEAVLVHRMQGKVRVLNGVGARIWELADGRRSLAAVADLIAGEYAVDLARAESDTVVFCTELVERGLLTLSG